MVEQLCTSGAGVDVVEGVAGAGKTYALAAARRAWTAAGYNVRGASLAARTAARLEAGAGIPSTSLDRLLASIERDHPLTDRDVIVIDEAGMVGTRKFARLLDHAVVARAKVVLIGDPRQLPEIDAGGAFAGLIRRHGDTSLQHNRRQHEPWERDALAALRRGDVDTAIAAYATHDRIHEPDDPKTALVADWWHSRQASERGLMIAPRLRDVDGLNRRARILLQVNGDLGTQEVRLGGRRFAVGDEILALRNDYRAEILNGTTGLITDIDRDHRLLRLDCDGRTVVVPFAYADAGDLTHGYATTLHKAQGATIERSFVLADETFAREHLYTALSRGTHRNDLYLATHDVDDEQHAPGPTDDRAPAARIGRRSAAQQLALDHADDRLAPTHLLEAERRRIVDGFRDAPDDPNVELREVQRRIRDRQRDRASAVARHDRATAALDDLGIVGRLLHRQERVDLERTIANAAHDVTRADTDLANLAASANDLTAALPAWRAWQRAHQLELDRLRSLNHVIADRRLEVSIQRATTVDHEVDLGVGL